AHAHLVALHSAREIQPPAPRPTWVELYRPDQVEANGEVDVEALEAASAPGQLRRTISLKLRSADTPYYWALRDVAKYVAAARPQRRGSPALQLTQRTATGRTRAGLVAQDGGRLRREVGGEPVQRVPVRGP